MLKTFASGSRATGAARLWAEIDLAVVRRNVRALRARLAADCELIAVVKADAYGHGAVPISRAVLQAGATRLAVADAAEGVRLRSAGITAEIHLLGPSVPEDAAAIVRHRLIPSVADVELSRALALAAEQHGGAAVPIELEVDTGMCRHGLAAEQVVAFASGLRAAPRLRLQGVFTHFAGLDRIDLPAMRAQWRRFVQVREALGAAGLPLRAHACNSLAVALLPEAHADAVRVGGGLYGIGCAAMPELQPALTLKSRVVGLRPVAAGACVGYGSTHRCDAATELLLLPCGYADGLSRPAWNGAEVLVRGRSARVVGHVSMNQLVVDAGPHARCAIGDEVVLIGRQGDLRVAAEERARDGASPYEITTLLRPELPRRYRDAELPAGRW